MTRDEIVDLLELLVANYPNTKINDPDNMVNAWEMVFAEDPAEDIYKAARHHINVNKFFPTPAELRKEVPKALMLYSEETELPKIEAPATSYIEDNSIFDNLVEEIPAENDHCKKCILYERCRRFSI